MFVFIHCIWRISFADKSMQALLAAVVVYVFCSSLPAPCVLIMFGTVPQHRVQGAGLRRQL